MHISHTPIPSSPRVAPPEPRLSLHTPTSQSCTHPCRCLPSRLLQGPWGVPFWGLSTGWLWPKGLQHVPTTGCRGRGSAHPPRQTRPGSPPKGLSPRGPPSPPARRQENGHRASSWSRVWAAASGGGVTWCLGDSNGAEHCLCGECSDPAGETGRLPHHGPGSS